MVDKKVFRAKTPKNLFSIRQKDHFSLPYRKKRINKPFLLQSPEIAVLSEVAIESGGCLVNFFRTASRRRFCDTLRPKALKGENKVIFERKFSRLRIKGWKWPNFRNFFNFFSTTMNKSKIFAGIGLLSLLLAVTFLSVDAFGGRGGMRGGFGGEGIRNNGEERGGFLNDEKVVRTVSNIDNGVEITMASEDADTATRLQSMPEPKNAPLNEKITSKRENIENGVKITITSADAETVKQIQERSAEAKKGVFGRGGQRGGMMGGADVDRTVNNIANGVEIIMTSENSAAVERMQSMEPQMPLADENVNVQRENLENGVKITITSADAETVKTIQERAQNATKGAFGGGRGGMMPGGFGRGEGGCPFANQ